MKRIAAIAVAIALLLSAFALAFDGTGYPQWDGVTAPDNGLSGTFGDQRISLSFDPSIDYSNVADGTIQACFFAYDATEEHYLEIYLLFPQTVIAGDALYNSDNLDCSICLYETAVGKETLYYAGSAPGESADGSSFELRFESVENSDSAIHIEGQLRARLCRYEGDEPTQELLTVEEAHFSFTLPLASSAPSQAPGAPSQPEATFPAPSNEAPENPFPAPSSEAPEDSFPGLPGQPGLGGAPAFTLPPDYAVI